MNINKLASDKSPCRITPLKRASTTECVVSWSSVCPVSYKSRPLIKHSYHRKLSLASRTVFTSRFSAVQTGANYYGLRAVGRGYSVFTPLSLSPRVYIMGFVYSSQLALDHIVHLSIECSHVHVLIPKCLLDLWFDIVAI